MTLVRTALFLVVALLGGGCSSTLGAPRPATEQGEAVLDLWRVLFWTAAALGALVAGLVLWCLVRYRRTAAEQDDDLPPQVPGNRRLEIVYTAIPVLIVAALFALNLETDRKALAVSRRPALRVDVTGFQWQWRFDYPDQDVLVEGVPGRRPVLVLPAGQRVRLHLRSADVVHSLFVPGFLTKKDVVPGTENRIELRPVRTGTFRGHCAEFCGLDHARMNFDVRVVRPEEFDRWVRARQGEDAS